MSHLPKRHNFHLKFRVKAYGRRHLWPEIDCNQRDPVVKPVVTFTHSTAVSKFVVLCIIQLCRIGVANHRTSRKRKFAFWESPNSVLELHVNKNYWVTFGRLVRDALGHMTPFLPSFWVLISLSDENTSIIRMVYTLSFQHQASDWCFDV